MDWRNHGEITFGLNSEYSEQASYGKLREEWVESVVWLRSPRWPEDSEQGKGAAGGGDREREAAAKKCWACKNPSSDSSTLIFVLI